jgi:hypothetical protein
MTLLSMVLETIETVDAAGLPSRALRPRWKPDGLLEKQHEQ